MKLTRKYTFYIVLALLSAFSCHVLFSTGLIDGIEISVNGLIDFEDNAASSENAKDEKELKDYKISNLNTLLATNGFVGGCIKFGQFDLSHSMEVFNEVITPPPDA